MEVGTGRRVARPAFPPDDANKFYEEFRYAAVSVIQFCLTIRNGRDGGTNPNQASELVADADPPRSCTNESAMMPYMRMTSTELMTSEAS